jgi:hypothetical protein
MHTPLGAINPFLIDVIDISADIATITEDCEQIVAAFKQTAVKTNDLTKPYSIVLTHNPGVDESKGNLVSYSEIHNQRYFDRENQAVLQSTYAKTSLGELVRKLPFPFSIIRISVLPPNTIISMHTDNACHAQLAVKTNQDCFVAARTGETRHIPADGKLYVISTTLPHTAFNASQEERSHISISIFDEDYVKLLRGGSFRG